MMQLMQNTILLLIQAVPYFTKLRKIW